MAYKVQDHAIDNFIPHKRTYLLSSLILKQTRPSYVLVPKAIIREKMASLLPKTWITNYEKLFEHTKPLQSTDATFTFNPNKMVTIKLSRDDDKETTTPSSMFPTQYMM